MAFDYRYSFKVNNGKLVIRQNDALPKGFWGLGVYSLTAIMGNNGAGKTTALRFLMDALVNRKKKQAIDGIIVYEDKGKLLIYQPQRPDIPQLSIESEVEYNTTDLIKIETLHYSGHFQPYTSAEDGDDFETSGCYIATDQWLLIKDLQDYTRKESLKMTHSLYSHLSAYYAQNHYRICELLTLKGLELLMPDFRWPKYIIFGPNLSANITTGDLIELKKLFNVPDEISISEDNQQISIGRLIYNNVLNLIAEGRGNQKELAALLREWQKTKKQTDVLGEFEKLVNNLELSKDTYKSLKSEIYVLRKLLSICKYSSKGNVFYLITQEEKESLRKLNTEIFNSQYFLNAKFYDVFYSHDLESSSKLSSGEQEFLNLLSRLYYGITLQPNKKRAPNPRILLIDEAEIGFHPNWQKKYVDLLLKFLQMMSVKPGVDFQVVITSHSPIILSDIPKCCVNFIKRDKDGSTINEQGEPETFGENIFNLYRRAFFMDDGLIGSFATDKLRKMFDRANSGDVDEEMMKEVAIIGDNRIREALVCEIGRYRDDMAKVYYQRKLDEINKRRSL